MNVKCKVLLLGLASLVVGCSSYQYRNIQCNYEHQPVQEEINLAADALFKFNKYAEDDLLAKGKATLDDLANKLMTGYTHVNAIALVGHTDRLGSDDYNYTLGLNRAETVKAYLQSHGIQTQISVDSAGENEPVTDGCYGVSPKHKLTECLQPDRRVIVKIEGIRKLADKK
ncbi:Outer membrane protein II* [Phocoenobacter uteri]|uniref:Outer membrane protein II n=1 Tax=Phocoenobacter uteri TaxID=146806 RepID=A0A379C8A9_9PAST|nr:OmpA family protein [Phocoenobacter uteri]MDG6882375.1 hypothetical protein [Phocoenobacter uteri]SUB58533.1 Outer membrane protein II* [Phocoenobacter uteri]